MSEHMLLLILIAIGWIGLFGLIALWGIFNNVVSISKSLDKLLTNSATGKDGI